MPLHRLVPCLLALAVLAAPSAARAHLAELEAVLDTVQETPAPVGAAGASGTGKFVLQEDGTIEAEAVAFQGLTGVPILAHIHQGAPGVVGPVVVDFTARLPVGSSTAGTITGPGSRPLTAAEQTTLFAGGMYFNIHTVANTAGEIRGQIHLVPGVCSCNDATSRGAFRSCVKKAIRLLEKDERKEEAVKALRKQVAKSACGKKKAPRKTVACCLPFNPAQNIVTDRMCATVKESKCMKKLGGSSLGAGTTCSPNRCRVGSPSGAFLGPAS
jgi:hypothetical protein